MTMPITAPHNSCSSNTSSNYLFNTSNNLQKIFRQSVILFSIFSNRARSEFNYDMRRDVPTLDSLQVCNWEQSLHFRTTLVKQNSKVEKTTIYCLASETFDSYLKEKGQPGSDMRTDSNVNCYRDALGKTGWHNPGLISKTLSCKSLAAGALRDGAQFAFHGHCPSDRREMRFFIKNDRSDYHVLSRKPNEPWQHKFSGWPRLKFTGEIDEINGIKIAHTTLIRVPTSQEQDKFEEIKIFFMETSNDYSITCPEKLCSLPIDSRNIPQTKSYEIPLELNYLAARSTTDTSLAISFMQKPFEGSRITPSAA